MSKLSKCIFWRRIRRPRSNVDNCTTKQIFTTPYKFHPHRKSITFVLFKPCHPLSLSAQKRKTTKVIHIEERSSRQEHENNYINLYDDENQEETSVWGSALCMLKLLLLFDVWIYYYHMYNINRFSECIGEHGIHHTSAPDRGLQISFKLKLTH